jgi:hypothetical protein
MTTETIEPDVKEAYIRLHGEWAWDEEHCINSYLCKFDTKEEAEA